MKRGDFLCAENTTLNMQNQKDHLPQLSGKTEAWLNIYKSINDSSH